MRRIAITLSLLFAPRRRRLWRRRLRGRRQGRRRQGPDHDLVLEQPGGGGLGQGDGRAWNAAHPKETGHRRRRSRRARPPRRSSAPSITAGNAPCLIFNTSPAAVPQFQKQGGLVAARRLPGRQGVRRGAQRRRRRAVPVRGRQVLPAAVEVEPGDDLLQQEAASRRPGSTPKNPPLATYDEFLATSRKLVSSKAAEAAIWPSPESQFFQSWFDFYPLFIAESDGKPTDGGRQGAVRRRGGPEGRGLLADDVRREARRRTRSTTVTRSASRRPRCRSSVRGRSRSTARTSTGAPRRCRPRPASRPVRSRPSATRSRRPCTPPARTAARRGSS